MAKYSYVEETGLILPDTGTLRTDVEGEWRTAFGADLVTSSETPQGVQITSETEARDAVVRNNCEVANQINPDYATGPFLDALWRITGGSRKPATYSLAAGVLLTGTPGTIVPAESRVSVEGTGESFRLLANAIIGVDGTVAADFQAVNPGPVAATAGSLINIESSVLGWETATNPSAAAVGSDVEAPAAARRRRRLTLALQGAGTAEAIVSNLANVDGFRSLVFRENVKSTAQVIDGVTLAPNSIYAVVDGGSDADVAAALLDAKDGGCNWNGATVVQTVSPWSGQPHDVQFDRAVGVPVYVRVTAKFNNLDGYTVIPSAVQQYASGQLEGEPGFVVGQGVSPFELAGAINQVEPRIYVTRVETSTDGVTFAVAEVPVTIQQKAVLASVVAVPA